MKKTIAFFVLFSIAHAKAQVKIGDNPTTISPGSLLELESTSKALTLPRMTTVEMEAIPSPLSGMIVFNTDSNCIYLYKTNNVWASITMGSSTHAWPYSSNDNVVGSDGNAVGIIARTGSGLIASGNYSHAEGVNSIATGTYSWSAGYADTSSNMASAVFGAENKASGAYSFIGGYRNIVTYQASSAFGQNNYDSGWTSVTMGLQNRIFNGVSYSHALGYDNKIKAGLSNIALGEYNTINGGQANFNAGYGNISSGNYNALLGKSNQVNAGNSNFVSGDGNLVKSGASNTLGGYNNIADGSYLAALGYNNIVYYQSAVAMGQNNKDSGYASIAGGLDNIIEKGSRYSSVFGMDNYVTSNTKLVNGGAGNFTAGINNVNTGYGSIALGVDCRTTHNFSMATNLGTMANSLGMSALGHYNDTTAAYQGDGYLPGEILFTVGNGNSSSLRRNSLTMLRNGFTTINASTELGPNVPRAELDVKGTGAIIVPVGTTAQRPATPVAGMIRFCTDCPGGPLLQGYDGSAWVNL